MQEDGKLGRNIHNIQSGEEYPGEYG